MLISSSLICIQITFSMDFERFGKTETIDLKENGRNIPVTNENKLEYVHLICQEKMVGSVKNQVKFHPKKLFTFI